MRTYTLREAAELTGLSQKAIRSRADRGALRFNVVDGRRRVPASELIRAGLLDASGGAVEAAQRGSTGPGLPQGNTEAASPADVRVVVDVNALVARVEDLTADLARHRLLTTQAESRTAALENELHEARARVTELEALVSAPAPQPDAEISEALHAAQARRRSWWPFTRSRSASAGDVPAHAQIPGMPPPA
jgi:hypothetical protein